MPHSPIWAEIVLREHSEGEHVTGLEWQGEGIVPGLDGANRGGEPPGLVRRSAVPLSQPAPLRRRSSESRLPSRQDHTSRPRWPREEGSKA
jgi:hypothetical protein